jgi:hypothetical protein
LTLEGLGWKIGECSERVIAAKWLLACSSPWLA